MKILTIYYSYSGKCAQAAQEIAKKRNTSLYEIKDKKRPSFFSLYLLSCPKAMLGKTAPIEPITIDLNSFDRIIIVSPIWASHTVPPINTILNSLPTGKKIEVIAISKSGKSKCKDKVSAKIKKTGAVLVRYKDRKSSELS